jgi:hypothetical protein
LQQPVSGSTWTLPVNFICWPPHPWVLIPAPSKFRVFNMLPLRKQHVLLSHFLRRGCA